jgi:hypothetical protein
VSGGVDAVVALRGGGDAGVRASAKSMLVYGGKSEWERKETYGRGMEITTSCRVTFSFSSSYSMLTSQVPSFEGEGQQLT